MNNIPEFLLHLRQLANTKHEDAGFNGSMDDGGASELEEQIEVYRAGSSNTIPNVWEEKYKSWTNENDPEYAKYLKLKERFEK